MIRLGDAELVPLTDAVAVFPLDALFPTVAAAQWDELRALYPETFDGSGGWRSRFGSYLVCTADTTVLVDTGVGPGPPASLGGVRGRLDRELARVGASPAEVDVVFLTHLHVDHVGWNVSEGAPRFPRARYVAGRADWESASDVVEEQLPLQAAGVLELVEAPSDVGPGLTAIATPGHTPGHLALRVESRGETALLLGDVALHPAQLAHPDWPSSPDADRELATRTRAEILRSLEPNTLVACSHFPGTGLGRMRSGRWQPVD